MNLKMKYCFPVLVLSLGFQLAGAEPAIQNTRPAFFGDEFIQTIRNTAPGTNVSYRDIYGIRTPFVNDNGLWGVRIYGGLMKPKWQLDYEAAWLSAQGVNFVRTSGDLGDQNHIGQSLLKIPSFPLEHWKYHFDTLNRYGISFILDHASVRARNFQGFLPWEKWAWVDDRIIDENGTPGYFYHSGATGNFMNPAFMSLVEEWYQVLAGMLQEQKNFIGINVSNEPDGTASFGAFGQQAWHHFLMEQFEDITPNDDSNGDGATFNKLFSTNYTQWPEVPMFKTATRDSSPAAWKLHDLFCASVWSNYQQKAATAVHTKTPNAYATMSGNGYVTTGQDLSCVAGNPDVTALFRNVYGDQRYSWACASMAHAYNKPFISTEINLYLYQDPSQMYPYIASTLPYHSGYLWFTLSYVDDYDPGCWGQEYNIVDYWQTRDCTFFDVKKKGSWKSSANWDQPGEKYLKPAVFDPRWEAFPKFAPFVSRFSAAGEEKDSGVLWVFGHRADPGLLYHTHATTDRALALHPDALNLSTYPVVILNAPAKFATLTPALMKRLEKYIQDGGVLVTSLAELAGQTTITGQPLPFVLDGVEMKQPVGPIFDTGESLTNGLKPYLKGLTKNVELSNSWMDCILITDNKPGYALFEIPIPNQATQLVIDANLIPWDQYGVVSISWSADNKTWKPLAAGEKEYQYNFYTRKLDCQSDLRGSKKLFLKADLQHKPGGPSYPLKYRWYNTTMRPQIRGLQIKAYTGRNYAGEYTCTMGDSKFNWAGELNALSTSVSSTFERVGTITTSKSTYPLAFVRSYGRGKLILINDPDMLKFNIAGSELPFAEWNAKQQCLSALVNTVSGKPLPNIAGLHLYESIDKNATLAIHYSDPVYSAPLEVMKRLFQDKLNTKITQTITTPAPAEKVVVFDAFEHKLVGGPFLTAANGVISFPATFGYSMDFHIWVKKPYLRPMKLYADGTLHRAATIDDGVWDEAAQTLTVDLTDIAYISSPTKPASVTLKQGQADWQYDDIKCLLTIRAGGIPTQATVQYGK